MSDYIQIPNLVSMASRVCFRHADIYPWLLPTNTTARIFNPCPCNEFEALHSFYNHPIETLYPNLTANFNRIQLAQQRANMSVIPIANIQQQCLPQPQHQILMQHQMLGSYPNYTNLVPTIHAQVKF